LKQIPRDSKVLSISHNDLDGAASQIVLGHIFEDITYLNTSFYKIDSVLESVDYDKYDFVFVTDINPERKENLDLSEKIILIDHHGSAIDAHNPSKMHFVMPGKCAALRTKTFVEKYYGVTLDHLDDLIRLTNDYDMWELKDPKSKQLNDVMFYLYRPKKFRDQFFDGRTTFTEKETEWLEERERTFARLYDELTIFEFDKINGVAAESKEFINEICDKLMKEEGYNIVFIRNPWHGRVSIRHNLPEEELDMGTILKEKGWGGGHCQSCGMFCDDMDDYQMKIEALEELISKSHPKQ